MKSGDFTGEGLKGVYLERREWIEDSAGCVYLVVSKHLILEIRTMGHEWIRFDAGKSLGQRGSEDGKIIRDEENILGARVTLEEKGNIAPYSITLGIYGLTFHTEFFSTLDQGQKCFELFKDKIELIIDHHSAVEQERDSNWTITLNQLMEELLNVC
jgi:hypothetical protein